MIQFQEKAWTDDGRIHRGIERQMDSLCFIRPFQILAEVQNVGQNIAYLPHAEQNMNFP